MWPFRKTPPIATLTCHGKGCTRTLEITGESGVPSHVTSMRAAIKAHEAGWYAASGPILCPECAAILKSQDGAPATDR
jgi:hypothetical protein